MTFPWDAWAQDIGYPGEREMLEFNIENVRDLADQLGVETQHLDYRYRRAGIPRLRRKTIKEQLLEIPPHRREHLTARQLGEMFGVDPASVTLRANREGIKIKKRRHHG